MVPHRGDLPPFPCKVINKLNPLAGQLYFRSIVAYEGICRMLALYLKELPDDLERHADAFGTTVFVQGRGAREALRYKRPVFQFPVESLRKFIGPRRKARVYTWDKCYTHVSSMKLILVTHYAFSGIYS